MTWLWYSAAAAAGVAVALGEILSKYRDSPRHLFGVMPLYVYLFVNSAASFTALGIIRAFGWNFGIHTSGHAREWVQVLIAGVGSMAVLRSSLANVRVRGADLSVGLQVFLDAILSTADRGVDRAEALRRNKQIEQIMDGLEWAPVRAILPQFCFQLLQNSRPEEEAAIGASARTIGDDDRLPDDIKCRMLGLQLMSIVGPDVLSDAVSRIRPRLVAPSPPEQDARTTAPVSPRVRRALELVERLALDPHNASSDTPVVPTAPGDQSNNDGTDAASEHRSPPAPGADNIKKAD